MKRIVTAVAVAVLIAAGSIVSAHALDNQDDKQSVKTVTVETLAKSAKKFEGLDVTVKGVVASVSKDKKVFTLVDDGACGGCPSKSSCGKVELSVSYQGKMPKKKRSVAVTGRLTQPEEGRYLFVAQNVE
jgi:hypothetical protein